MIRQLILVAILATAIAEVKGQTPVDFDRDVRPILSSHCYQCHGPDPQAREADLRLDTRTGLFGMATTGKPIITPNDPNASHLYHRVTSNDTAERMPPAEGGKPLSPDQVETLRRWIDQGSPWRGRWSYEPILRPTIPHTDHGWSDNPIDAFLQARWLSANLEPAVEADFATLKRRLSFDLTGLPPYENQLQVDEEKVTVEAISKQVEQFLSSPHFGERMAVYWLDLVRYADSCGYHSDVDQAVSPYRDYVIQAFNQNKSFDEFTRDQLAGDLLPDAKLEQQIASGFNRLSKSTEEGGAQEGEYLAKAFADRVRTVSGTWLASTLGCAECHDHKFDPITARDFYSLGAFFADVKEKGVYPNARHDPELLLPTTDQKRQLASLEQDMLHAREQLQDAGESQSERRSTLELNLKKIEQQQKELDHKIARTSVTVSVAAREIRILPRGDWLNLNGDVVLPAFPEALPHPEPKNGRLTRLDLADWLMHRENPLTARVFVNRLWKLFFGTGLVRTLDDLGAQGETPSHPDLLDWLAAEFIESQWDIKHMVRLMVTSRAYRLSSIPTAEQMKLDPQNRLYSRQSRWRLDAEFLRDNALAVSGLLVDTIGGPSVKPYQPEGYWEFLNFPKRTWKNSTGAAQYRRGLYTHWQRTFLHPSLLAFDAPSREECTAIRTTSNTPKSALTLLNDPSFVEAARVFAERIQHEGGDSDKDRLIWAWHTTLSRRPDNGEVNLLNELLLESRSQYQREEHAAISLLSVGQAPAVFAKSAEESAAWIAVSRAILNLHEFTTRN